MPRIARIVAEGYPHHITQRGNRGENVFINDTDREKYLQWVQEYSKRYGVKILAYCLMSNHVHFIAIPDKSDALSKTFNSAHMRYSHYFNKRVGTSGHLWQGRFYSCAMDENHLMAGVKYIECNPVRAKIVKEPWRWKWSSAQYHCNNKQENAIIELADLFKIIGSNSNKWKEYISERENLKETEGLKKHTLTGRPLGEDKFIEKMEYVFGRRLRALPHGRPRKRKEE